MPADTHLLFGFHPVTARLRHHPESVREIYVHAGRSDPRLRELMAVAQQRGIRVLPVDEKRLQGLAGAARHQGVIALVDEIARPVDLQDLLEGLRQPAFLLLLDGVPTRIIWGHA